jgi:cell division protein FtsQ
MSKKKSLTKKLVKLVLIVASPIALGGIGVLTWQWREDVVVERIDVLGERYAAQEGVARLARVGAGDTLYHIQPALIADRVRRHPWVREASVSRIPTGTLRIRVTEREPVALVLQREGTPVYYLDENGFAMPQVDSVAFDVPLVSGLSEPYQPAQAISHKGLVEMLGALATATAEARALISEILVQPSGELVVYTTASEAHGPIPVRMGKDAFSEKLERLHAFWQQAVLPQPGKTFTSVDLRFDSQIVTEEAAGDQASAISD